MLGVSRRRATDRVRTPARPVAVCSPPSQGACQRGGAGPVRSREGDGRTGRGVIACLGLPATLVMLVFAAPVPFIPPG
jgi:hypothetical protein